MEFSIKQRSENTILVNAKQMVGDILDNIPGNENFNVLNNKKSI